MNELALFAGAGGGILGSLLHGWRTVCAVEIEDYPRRVLLQRQSDGILPKFPIWDDVTTFDGNPWRGRIDIITGGFPCQDISLAGSSLGERKGLEGDRSGLWSEMSRIISEVRPRFALVENSPALTLRGLGTVLGDLAKMGFDAEWGVLGADDAEAPHKRDRIWILAHPNKERQQQGTNNPRKEFPETGRGIASECSETLGNPHKEGLEEWNRSQSRKTQPPIILPSWWKSEPGMGRMVNGLAHRVDRLAALGNGQVPAVVKLAVEVLGRGK